MLVTANPSLLETKPESKLSIKILTEYNKDSEADYEYKKLSDLINNKEEINKLISK